VIFSVLSPTVSTTNDCMVVCEELYVMFWTSILVKYCVGVLASFREPELCLSVADVLFFFCFFLSGCVLCNFVCKFGGPFPYGINFEINKPRRRKTSET